VDGAPLATHLPGQFLTIKLPTGIVRNWSISDWVEPSDPEYYRLSIKKQQNGSLWMHENCTVGTILQARSPAGTFVIDWEPKFPGRQIYISAGIGVTPILSMVKAHMKHYAMSMAPAIWIHVSRNGALPSIISRFVDKERLVQRVRFFTIPRPEDQLNVDYEYTGRPGLEDLRQLISGTYFVNPLKITPIEIPGLMSTFYICGPTAFETEMKNLLRELGVNEGMIRSESFSGTALIKPAIKRGKVRFTKSKKTVEWDDGGSKMDCRSILEIAEAAGLTPSYGCRVGSCGGCKVRISSGSVSGGLQPDGNVHICVAAPSSEFVEVQV
jgi:ferredoxin-NADP reductase